jgi:peptidoglycan/LPS O-acetylase OafA/YrhL
MAITKGNYLQGGTAVRLFLSLIVVFSHFGSLTGLYRNKFLFDADFAVSCFFILSGYAMMHSYRKLSTKQGGTKAFYTQRFFRIMVPVSVLVVLQIILLYIISSASFFEYVGVKTWKYLFANISLLNFLEQNLPGVFTSLPTMVVNGSLWTMKIEMSFYLLFPLLFSYVEKEIKWLLAILIGSVAYRLLFAHWIPELSYQLPGQLYFFITGMLIYKFGGSLQNNTLITATGLALLIKNSIWGYHILETTFSFPLILLSLSALFSRSDTFFKSHDYSFTIYLLHWPIIQVGTDLFFQHSKPIEGIAFIVCTMAICSFVFKKNVEDNAVKWGREISMYWLKMQ